VRHTDATPSPDDPARPLDRSCGIGLRDTGRLVLGARLHRHEPTRLLCDRDSVGAGRTQERDRLVVILAGCADASRSPVTASAALMPAWMARLVAAIGRPASSSEPAADRYSSALPMKART
jgi:hypothetical protein